jgi:CheY-like chemotaxis protein
MNSVPAAVKTKATVLVVEDDVLVAETISEQLQALGYTVVGHTAMGEDAVSLARDLKPDLTLMDIQLAGRLDGIEAAALVRSLRIPVVYLTASSDTSTLERAKLTEPFGFITKPFEDRDLKVAIEMALYKHQMEQERDRLTEQLRDALANVKTLVGLLPICAYCKKIKDNAGYWSQVEAYIMKNSDASFSHGMCPECFERVKKEIDSIEKTGSAEDSSIAGH